MEDKMMFIAIFSGIFCGMGLIFLMVSWILSSVMADRKKHCTSKTVGTVIDMVRSTSDIDRENSIRGFHPVVQYTTARGETVTVTSAINNSPPKYHVGENVHIRYDPNEPKKFYIDGDKTLNTVKTVFFWVGLGLAVTSVVVGALVFIFA